MSTWKVVSLMAVCSLIVLAGILYFVYEHWYIPRRVRQRWERLEREEREGAAPSPRDYHYAITFDSVGLKVINLRSREPEAVGMRWGEVSRVTAFKRDLFTVDCICLFLASARHTGIELNEEMAGWKRLMEALPQHLPGAKPWPEWFQAVAFPAFALNETQVYAGGTKESS